MLDRTDLDALVELAERSGAVLLVDETYRDLTHGELLPMAATPFGARDLGVVDVEGVRASRACGSAGPCAATRSSRETLLAAKEQMVICGATIDEAIAGRVLADRDRILPPIIADVRARLDHRARVDGRRSRRSSGSNRPAVSSDSCASAPTSTSTPRGSTTTLLATHGTYVGPGHWFEVDDRHFRLGFGWPTRDELRAGLTALSKAATA